MKILQWGIASCIVFFSSIFLALGQEPYIIAQPTNQTVTVGGTATFSVTAGGTAPLSYQWYFDTTNLVGTNASLVLFDVSSADVGPYYVKVENAFGSTNSHAATLRLSSSGTQAPYVISQPTNETVTAGSAATFSVTAGGTAPLSYQWYFDETNLVGTNATLFITNAMPADAGPYFVAVENAYGSTNSQMALLTVASSSPPTAPFIVSQPTNETVVAGTPAIFSVTVAGTAPLSYQWYFDETNLVGTNATLIITNATPADAGPYFVAIENAYGSTNSHAAILTVTSSSPPAAPFIVSQPTNETVAAGTPAKFSVTVTGTAPLSYQWYFDETNLVGTNATLIITNATPADAGPYFVAVENAYGSTNSVTAVLTVTSSGPPTAPYIFEQPTNETVAAGGTATFSVDAGGVAPLSYQWYYGETNLVGTNATLVLNDVTAANAGPYNVMIENAYGSTNSHAAILTVTSSSPPTAPFIVSQPTNETVVAGTPAKFSVTVTGTTPLSYQWYFDYTNLVGTNATLIISNATAADAGSYFVTVENAYGSTNSDIATLTVNSASGQAPYIITQPTNATVTAGGTAIFRVTAGGTAPLSYDWYFDGTNIVGTNATLSIPNVTTADAGGYSVTVENPYGSTNSITAILTVNSPPPPQAPYIIDQPTNETVTAGTTAKFSVIAGGTAPLNYQWYFDETNLVGTNAMLILTNATAANAGPYFVVVENAYGSTNSTTAILTVNSSGPPTAPYIISQPTNETVAAGGTATFSLDVAGAAPLSYQWYFDTTNLVGTNATLTLNNVSAADAGPYYVAIENAYGSTNSHAAILTVTSSGPSTAPYIIEQPTNETVAADDTAKFTVIAGGTQPLSYQWYFDETNLVGTNATLIVTNATPADAGQYFATVENPFGSTNSTIATLTVGTNAPSAVDHFIWSPIPSPRFNGVPFAVTVTAYDVGGAIVTNFTGTVQISVTNGIPVFPPALGNFVYGSSTGSVVVLQPGTNLVLNAADASGHTGLSNPFNVENLPVLTSACCSNIFQVAWPAASSGFVLEMTTNLASGNWVVVPGQPLQSSNLCMQAVTPTCTNNVPVFYRLHYMGQ